MLKLRKGLRLESLQLPFKRALQAAAELRAEGIEINARTEIRPAELTRTGIREIRKLLSDFRLSICCVNFPTRHGYAESADLDRRLDATRAAMRMAYDLGCNVVSNRIGPIPDPQSTAYSTMIQALHDIGQYGQRVGAWLAARTGDNSGPELADFVSRLGPGTLSVDFDPAALMAGDHDVLQAMNALGNHVVHFRARDAVRELSRGENTLVQLGRGSIDFPPLLAILEEHHYSGFLTVQTTPGPDARRVLGQELEYLDNAFA